MHSGERGPNPRVVVDDQERFFYMGATTTKAARMARFPIVKWEGGCESSKLGRRQKAEGRRQREEGRRPNGKVALPVARTHVVSAPPFECQKLQTARYGLSCGAFNRVTH
jgi:hypothetical protein